MTDAQQRKMVAGSIALQDHDRLLRALPGTSVLVDFARGLRHAFRAGGGNGSTGRVLPVFVALRLAARNVKTKIHASFVDVGDSRRTITSVCWR